MFGFRRLYFCFSAVCCAVTAAFLVSCDSFSDTNGYYGPAETAGAYLNQTSNYVKFVDSRDGKAYYAVSIGSLRWLAQNLDYAADSSSCYADSPDSCAKYGRLYSWNSAMAHGSDGSRGVCPEYWRVPTDGEWNDLETRAGGWNIAGASLKSASGWISGEGTDDYGFSVLPAGFGYERSFAEAGVYASFWSATDGDSIGAYYRSFHDDYASMGIGYSDKADKRSVRCVQDTSASLSVTVISSSSREALSSSFEISSSSISVPVSSSSESSSSELSSSSSPLSSSVASSSSEAKSSSDGSAFTDARDGQVYKTVTIGAQTWMAQNLNYAVDSSWCYNNSADSCTKYGRLYQWAAAMALDSGYNSNSSGSVINSPHQGVCPSGWHIPTSTEWKALFTAVGGTDSAAYRLKKTDGWYNNGGGDDAYGFSMLPSGYRSSVGGAFANAGTYAEFWSVTEATASQAYNYYTYNTVTKTLTGNAVKSNAYSVRCIRN